MTVSPRDGRLAVAFCENARSFHAMAQTTGERCCGASTYYAAITIELGLKAYLLHRGTSDQWNRVHIRHDLNKALKCVRGAGFEGVPDDLLELAEALSPLYASGALRGLAIAPCPLPPAAADRAIHDLLGAVEAAIGAAGGAEDGKFETST